jgi:hypothetical protein
MRFEYYLVKLKHLDYRRYLDSANPLAYALIAKMNYNRRERVRLKADFLRLNLGSGVDPARRSVVVIGREMHRHLPTAGGWQRPPRGHRGREAQSSHPPR